MTLQRGLIWIGILTFCLTAVPSQAADKPVLVVFLMESRGAGLKADEVVALSDYLSAAMGKGGHYRVIPRDEIRKRLLSQKKKSYRECFDSSCQIELGRELAANKSLHSKVTRVGETCVLTATLFDLKAAASDRAATVQTACTPRALIAAVDDAVRQLLPQKKSSSVNFVTTGKTTKRLAADFDPKAFEPLGYLARAEKLARAEMNDARFLDFDAEGLGSRGTVNLALSKEWSVTYRFRSPEKSKRPAGLPSNVEFEGRCLVYVEVSARGVEVMQVSSVEGCKEAFLPRPRCPTKNVYARARASVSAEGELAAKLSWLPDGWYVDFGEENVSVPDDCH